MPYYPVLPYLINDESFAILERFYEDDIPFLMQVCYNPDEVIMIPCHTIFPFPLLSDDS